MNPLIDNFTNILKPCSGCQKVDLGNPEYDQFWKPKEKNNGLHSKSDETNSGDSGKPRGSAEKSS